MILLDYPASEGTGKWYLPSRGQYSVTRGIVTVDGFDSFFEAYRYALNRFGSEDFLVRKKGW
ncbi:hypothetical protein [Rufibacter roseolus]|uniref:hypothetical protein n=1 Tax=Rufibacter roseolus TaxID=2817375 RepID=UPI001B315AA3|nr:hypothetical protein [Rufibacter roseolus]